MRLVQAISVTFLLFVLLYAPVSALAMLLHFPLAVAVPFIMVSTLIVASGIIFGLSRRGSGGTARFGFRLPAPSYVGWAVGMGAPLAIGIALLLRLAHEPGPLEGLSLAPWLAVLYFVMGAAIQEEVIFRGLLQTVFADRADSLTAGTRNDGVIASLAVALLFGFIHLAVGPFTALAALGLGVLAGELRRRSGSLLPAIICHALFNLAGIIWA